jgi:hypothetical protein
LCLLLFFVWFGFAMPEMEPSVLDQHRANELHLPPGL